jgi:predicted nucleic acid-binding protein
LIVVDASVATKWVIVESETAAANELLGGHARLAAPSLIRLEVAGAALRRFRVGEFDRETAETTCRKWDRLIGNGYLSLIPTDDLYEHAIALALECRHPLADCLYLAAARSMECPLLTADRAMYERGRRVYKRIDLLAKAA